LRLQVPGLCPPPSVSTSFVQFCGSSLHTCDAHTLLLIWEGFVVQSWPRFRLFFACTPPSFSSPWFPLFPSSVGPGTGREVPFPPGPESLFPLVPDTIFPPPLACCGEPSLEPNFPVTHIERGLRSGAVSRSIEHCVFPCLTPTTATISCPFETEVLAQSPPSCRRRFQTISSNAAETFLQS